MFTYKTLEKSYCTEPNFAGYKSAKEALDSIIQEINHLQGFIEHMQFFNPKDGENCGSVLVTFKTKKNEKLR